jgi:hypothetical protein
MNQEVFEKWINRLDWAAPTLGRRKATLLNNIKQAKTDEEIIKICCGIFRCGYNQNFLDKLREKNNEY